MCGEGSYAGGYHPSVPMGNILLRTEPLKGVGWGESRLDKLHDARVIVVALRIYTLPIGGFSHSNNRRHLGVL